MWLFILLALIAIVILVRLLLRRGQCTPSNADALEILRQRFARGEIDEEEFERRRKALMNDS